MSLIVETGAIVAGAETLATVAELRVYADKYGLTVPEGDTDCERLLRKGMDWIQMQERRLKGIRVSSVQTLCMPRYDMYANNYYVPSDSIPQDFKNAQMQLAVEAQTVDLMPTLDAAKQTGPVIELTVDVITKKYAEPSVNRSETKFAKVEGFLARYMKGDGEIAIVRA